MARGRYTDSDNEITFSQCKWYIGDKEKVTAVPNVAFEHKGWGGSGHNGLCLVLVQPFTEEMAKNHKDHTLSDDKVIGLMNEKFNHDARDFKLSTLQQPLIDLCVDKKPPLLMFFNVVSNSTTKQEYRAKVASNFGYMFADRGRNYPDSKQYDMVMKQGFSGPYESNEDCRLLFTIFYQ